MYSKNSFGNFYPVDSALHRMNPVIKLLNFILMVVIILVSNSLEVHLFMLTLVFIMTLLSYVPTKYYLKTFYGLRYVYIAAIIIFASLGLGLDNAIVYLLKIIILIEYLAVIIYTTSPSELNYGIEKMLSPINILGFNLAKVALSITNAIRFFPLLIETGNKILKSESSRGIDYYNSDILGRIYAISHTYKQIIKLTIRKMQKIKENAEIRLFSIKRFRTNLRTNKVGFYDLMFFLFHMFILVSYLADRGYLNEVFARFNI